MHQLKLTYFDSLGRGEPARLALKIGNIPFEDERIPIGAWSKFKHSTPFGELPVLTVDGCQISQSNSINRFVGRLANLYPNDPVQALYCDEMMDAVDDLLQKVVITTVIADESKKQKEQEALLDGPVTLYLRRFEERLQENGGKYFAGNDLSVADLKVFVWVQYLLSGSLDYIPTETVERTAPCLLEHFNRISQNPAIKRHYGL